MAYTTGTATGPEDLLDKIFSFASSNGWTITLPTQNGYAHIQKNNINVGFYYESDFLKMYPSRGYNVTSPLTPPNQQTNASDGTSLSSDALGTVVNAIPGPYDSYFIFEDDNYLHVVIDVNGFYRHFGFGEGVQAGNFFGGEYFYGHYVSQLSNIDSFLSNQHSHPLNSITSQSRGGLCVYARKNESPMTAMSGATSSNTKWYLSESSAASLNDYDGDDIGLLIVSGTTGNISSFQTSIANSAFNGFTPFYPINVYIRNNSGAPDSIYPLISIPDVRALNIKGFQDAQEVVIGSDTWTVFPLTARGINPSSESSGNVGIAYKKVTT